MSKFTLQDLAERVKERAQASADHSYTRQLLDQGVAHCAKKFGEEAVETVLAAVGEDRERLIGEAADLIYHLLVLLGSARHLARRGRGRAGRADGAVGTGREGGAPESEAMMEQRTDDGLSPYRMFTREQWAALREDTPMTLARRRSRRCARSTTGST